MEGNHLIKNTVYHALPNWLRRGFTRCLRQFYSTTFPRLPRDGCTSWADFADIFFERNSRSGFTSCHLTRFNSTLLTTKRRPHRLNLGIALRETGFPAFPFSRPISTSRSRTGNSEFLVRETGNQMKFYKSII